MRSQHDPWSAPRAPVHHPCEPGLARAWMTREITAGPPQRTNAATPSGRGRRGLPAWVGLGLACLLLTSLSASALAADAPRELLASESFDRPEGTGWGRADSGQRWRSPQGATGLELAANGGNMTLPAPRSRRSALMDGRGMHARDVTIRFGFGLDRMPGRGSATILAVARNSAMGSYRALVRVAPQGGLWLSFTKERRGSTAGVGRKVLVPGWRYSAGQMVSVPLPGHPPKCHAAAVEDLADGHSRAGRLAARERRHQRRHRRRWAGRLRGPRSASERPTRRCRCASMTCA